MNSNNEWYTRPEIIELAREVLGNIDLDPASNDIAKQWVNAKCFYTKETNGLDKPWLGKIWSNPPYDTPTLRKFTNKFLAEYENGNMIEGIMLTNQGADTQFNIPLQQGVQVYTNGRISFLKPNKEEAGKPSRGQCFTYFGPNPKKFIEVFTRDNFCWCPNINLIKQQPI